MIYPGEGGIILSDILTLKTKRVSVHKPKHLLQDVPCQKRLSRKNHEKEPSMNTRTNKIPPYGLSSHDVDFNLLYFKGTKSKTMK